MTEIFQGIVDKVKKDKEENLGEKVGFILSLEIFRYMTPEECVAELKRSLGLAENENGLSVCLPLNSFDGREFENPQFPNMGITQKNGLRKSIGQLVADFADLGCGIYLYVNPALSSLKLPDLSAISIDGDELPKVCVFTQRARNILTYFISSGIESIYEHTTNVAIKGLVLDITSLWEFDADPCHISQHCFCDECIAALKEHKFDIDSYKYFVFPKIPTSRGGYSNSYPFNISKDEDLKSIEVKMGDGNQDNKPDHFEGAAKYLSQYLVARHRMISAFLADIIIGLHSDYDLSKERQSRSILMVNCTAYAWNGGIFPAQVSETIVDELWLEPSHYISQIKRPYKIILGKNSLAYMNAMLHYNAQNIDGFVGSLPKFSYDISDSPMQLIGLSECKADTRNGVVKLISSDDFLRKMTQPKEKPVEFEDDEYKSKIFISENKGMLKILPREQLE